MAKRLDPWWLTLRGEPAIEFELRKLAGDWRIEGSWAYWTRDLEALGPWPRDEGADELRKLFLSIERGDTKSLLDFLNRTGAWDIARTDFPLDEFWATQTVIRLLLTGKAAQVNLVLDVDIFNLFTYIFQGREDWVVQREGKKLTVSHALHETRPTLLLSAWLDYARGAKFRYCARPDCPDHRKDTLPFELTSRHHRRYCSQRCANVESMRLVRREKGKE